MSYIINPGSYSIKYVGKKQAGLSLDQAIGEFLILKGLATSEDCETFHLVCDACSGINGPTTVSTFFNPLNNQLLTTVNGVSSIATIYTDTSDVTLALPVVVGPVTIPATTPLSVALPIIIANLQVAIQFKEEGIDLGTLGSVNSVDFVGDGVTATIVGDALTVTIPGAAASSTNLGYIPSLTDGTVTSSTGIDAIIPIVTPLNAGLATPAMLANTGITNLTYTASPTNGIVNSDTGTDATIPIVNNTNAGLATPAMLSNSHAPATVTDTNSIDLTIAGQSISGAVRIDNTINSALSITANGLLFDGDGANTYSNTISGLTASTIQDAIDEVNGNVSNINGTNGLTRVADDIKLGGTLIEPTFIDGVGAHPLFIDNVDQFSVIVNSLSGDTEAYIKLQKIFGNPTAIRSTVLANTNNWGEVIVDAAGTGSKLSQVTGAVVASVNANLVGDAFLQTTEQGVRTLGVGAVGTFATNLPAQVAETEVIYVNSTTGVLSKGVIPSPVTITASNGLTKTLNNIELGGTLTQNTTINGGELDLFIQDIGRFGIFTDITSPFALTNTFLIGGAEPFLSSVQSLGLFSCTIKQDESGAFECISSDNIIGFSATLVLDKGTAEISGGNNKNFVISSIDHKIGNLNAASQTHLVYINNTTGEITKGPVSGLTANLPTASAANQVLVSTGPGTTYVPTDIKTLFSSLPTTSALTSDAANTASGVAVGEQFWWSPTGTGGKILMQKT